MSSLTPVSREDLLTAGLDGRPAVERVQVARVELAPAQAAGRHFHPCPVVGCVLSGAIRVQIAGEPERILEAGDAFFEPANVEVPHFDNASEAEPAVFVACYLLPPGENRIIEMLP
jgi:quercetin dioxygenase-like cupin family protein